ncbi:putative Leucine rich repeat [Trypanosoma vivax]|uniref:Leucine-rich repeat protein (LRRP) n=1 Tax=Trypanosoma vivax (strain Y486) TaxID=1055687 RepID=G0U6N7_TRYVY|nr:putative Leucine rich repeat [Trypanosoma vivax]CCC51541.1 conserved hypothetical protein [Trypanosoma vivax Y486]
MAVVSALPSSTVACCSNADTEGANPLSEETVRASLDQLGTNADGCLVYARCNLCGLQLTSIRLLSSYVHLQRLSLDGNQLVSLQPLQTLRSLVYLSAANNAINDAVFSDLASSSATLERLNLDGNSLTSLNGLCKLPFLMDFSASRNNITELSAADFAVHSSLTRLNLAMNNISCVHLDTFAKCHTIRTLNLSCNKIEDASFVVHLAGNLEVLNLRDNKVDKLTDFDVLRNLVFLYLSGNMIQDWGELDNVSDLTNLRILTLYDNPLLRAPAYPHENSDFPREDTACVAEDVDFVSSRVCNLISASTLRPVMGTTNLVSVVPPAARSVVQHIPVASQEREVWDNDSALELGRLPYWERCRLRIISIMPHIQVLDDVQVDPREIPRAMRLYKNTVYSAPETVVDDMGSQCSSVKIIEWRRIRGYRK